MAQNNETYTSQRKRQIAGIQAKICALLGWDEMTYNQFIYDNGVAFIRQYYRYADLIACAERSQQFWNWWKVIWWNDDENVLTFIIPKGFNKADVLHLYCQMHNIAVLVNEALPPRTVWDDIKNLQKQQSWA